MSEVDFDMEEEEVSQGDSAAWMATYGDLVTLLFCFFVLLFAMSSVQEEKFKQLAASLQSAMGTDEVPEAGTREGLAMDGADEKSEPDAVDELGGMVKKMDDEILSEIEELIMFNKLQGNVKVEGNENGATITISDMILFPSGAASMSKGGLEIIEKLHLILKQFDYKIRVLGHTDNVPINHEFYKSNWELSSMRACRIVKYFQAHGIDPKLLSAQGFAEFQPVADNRTAEGRAKNRRVEIVYERVLETGPDTPVDSTKANSEIPVKTK